MDRQKQFFEKLGFGPFLANLTTILFLPRKEKGDVFYASANYKVQEPNYTRPDDHRNYFEHDVIMTVVHCGERIDKGRTRRKIVVWTTSGSLPSTSTSGRRGFSSSPRPSTCCGSWSRGIAPTPERR